MGTRSVLAVPTEGGFQGRYAHWDGYPSSMGVTLLALVKRDGIETVIRTLTQDHYGWSSVNEATAAGPLAAGYDDGRFAQVEGYGTAYTTEQNQSSETDWITSSGDDWGTEWAYVLHPEHIAVYERRWLSGEHMTGMFGFGAEAGDGFWLHHADVPLDADPSIMLADFAEVSIAN